MSAESVYQFDIFVSYAHADNEKPLGSAAQYNWVTTLAHNLNTGPGHYRKNLFIDHQLKPGDAFSDDFVTMGEKPMLISERDSASGGTTVSFSSNHESDWIQ